jgi:hypothetical protein
MPSLRTCLFKKPSKAKPTISYPKLLNQHETQVLTDKLNIPVAHYISQHDLTERYKDSLVELGVVGYFLDQEHLKPMEVDQEQGNFTPVNCTKKSHMDDIPYEFMVMCARSKLCFTDDDDNFSVGSTCPSQRFPAFDGTGNEDESIDYNSEEPSYFISKMIASQPPIRTSSLPFASVAASPMASLPPSPVSTQVTLVQSPINSISLLVGEHTCESAVYYYS